MVLDACIITKIDIIFNAKIGQRLLSYDWLFINGKNGKFRHSKKHENCKNNEKQS